MRHNANSVEPGLVMSLTGLKRTGNYCSCIELTVMLSCGSDPMKLLTTGYSSWKIHRVAQNWIEARSGNFQNVSFAFAPNNPKVVDSYARIQENIRGFWRAIAMVWFKIYNSSSCCTSLSPT